MRIAILVAAVVMGVGSVAARSIASPAVETNDDANVLRLREAAWRAWFAGDEPALRRMLPADFIGVSTGTGPITTLEVTIGQSREFHAAGGRLVSLDFPETHFQRYGDVVVLYGRYQAVLDSNGQSTTLTGRLTEMFAKRRGTWVHTGWHLDSGR